MLPSMEHGRVLRPMRFRWLLGLFFLGAFPGRFLQFLQLALQPEVREKRQDVGVTKLCASHNSVSSDEIMNHLWLIDNRLRDLFLNGKWQTKEICKTKKIMEGVRIHVSWTAKRDLGRTMTGNDSRRLSNVASKRAGSFPAPNGPVKNFHISPAESKFSSPGG